MAIPRFKELMFDGLENVMFEPNTVKYPPENKQSYPSAISPDPFYQTIMILNKSFY